MLFYFCIGTFGIRSEGSPAASLGFPWGIAVLMPGGVG